jgi:hypothetical protein
VDAGVSLAVGDGVIGAGLAVTAIVLSDGIVTGMLRGVFVMKACATG